MSWTTNDNHLAFTITKKKSLRYTILVRSLFHMLIFCFFAFFFSFVFRYPIIIISKVFSCLFLPCFSRLPHYSTHKGEFVITSKEKMTSVIVITVIYVIAKSKPLWCIFSFCIYWKRSFLFVKNVKSGLLLRVLIIMNCTHTHIQTCTSIPESLLYNNNTKSSDHGKGDEREGK